MSTEGKHHRLRTDIQGLRALAVGSVVLFHTFPHALPGGFVGVDIFFVISGFLITGILYRDMSLGRFSFADFYRKRVRRIFPALMVVLLATLAVGVVLLSPAGLVEVAQNTLSSVFFVSNVNFYFSSGYFDQAATLRPLLHTWSLSVEEQFYIVFPLFMFLVMRFLPGALIWLLAITFALSLGLSEWAITKSPLGAYFLSPFRAFELLLGSLCALLPFRLRSMTARNLLVVCGLVLIIGSFALLQETHRFPGLMALWPTLGAGLILYAGREGPVPAARVLDLGPLRFIGDISYSLYLWHWPVLAYLRIWQQPEVGVGLYLASMAVSVLLAIASYHLVERRFMTLDPGRVPLLRMGAGGMAIVSLAALLIWNAGGMPQRFSPPALEAFAAAEAYSPVRSRCHRDAGQQLPYEKTCVLGDDSARPDLLVWGDSHGAELAFSLGQSLAEQGQSLRVLTASACPPVLDIEMPGRRNCATINAQMLEKVVQDPDIGSVILLVNAEHYLTSLPFERMVASYEALVTRLVGAGKRVVLVKQIPNINMDAPSIAGYAFASNVPPGQIGRDVQEVLSASAAWNGALDRIAAEQGVDLLDPVPLLCKEQICPIVNDDDKVLYFNMSHISTTGARILVNGFNLNQMF
nr:acyltransferase family protein [Oceanicola sp. S124]